MNPRLILLAAILLTATACSGDDDAETTSPLTDVTTTVHVTTTTEPKSTTTRPSTTTSTTPPTVTSTEPPATNTTSSTTIATDENWRAVIQTLGQRRQDLYAAPDVSRIPEVCSDQGQCAEQLSVQIADLASKGWSVVGADPFVVLDATLEGFDGDTLETSLLVTVVAVIQRQENAGSIVDSGGSVVAAVEVETSPGHNAQGRFLLGRVGPSDDPWRIVSQDKLPEVPA